MPRVAKPTPADQTTATGQAVNRAQKIAAKRGDRPAPNAERKGFDEFKQDTSSNPEPDPFDADGSTAAGPEAPKVAAKKAAPTKRAATKKAAAASQEVALPVEETSDEWFAPLSEDDDFLNVLWYGKEGSTKTTSLATASAVCPEGSKILIINAEGGLKVKALRKHGVDISKIRVFPDPKTDDVLDDASLERVFTRVQADLLANPKAWFAVGIDSITEVGQVLVDEAQGARVGRLVASGLKGVDRNFVDRDDYGVSAKIIRKQLRRFRDLPCHFLVTAMERRDVDDDTNKVQYGPAVSPAVANDLLGYVDIAIMIKSADDVKPIRGLTKEGGKYRVKDRFEILPKVMVEPTFDRIFAYWNEEETEENDAMQAGLPAAAPKGSATVAPEEDATQADK